MIGVDDDPVALDYACRNAAGTGVEVLSGDVTDPALLPDLDGAAVDLQWWRTQPYIPEGAELEPEVARHDPAHALFGGADGMSGDPSDRPSRCRLAASAVLLAVEHDDTTAAATVAEMETAPSGVTARRDPPDALVRHRPSHPGQVPTVTQLFDRRDPKNCPCHRRSANVGAGKGGWLVGHAHRHRKMAWPPTPSTVPPSRLCSPPAAAETCP